MRTTVDIDKRLLDEAMRIANARTIREVVHLSLTELVRRGRIRRLREKLGRADLDLDAATLERWRAGE